jgi:methyl-accepting chemotaxis protein
MEDDKVMRWEYQIKAILKFCFAFLVAVLVSGIFIYIKISETTGKNYYEVIYTLKTTQNILLQSVVLSVLFQILIGTVFTIIILIFVSHKIAGPFFRFEKIFENLGTGDLRIAIRLRDKDQFKALAEQLNNMIMSLKEKIKGVKKSYSQFDSNVEILKESIEKGIRESEFKEKVKELDKGTSELKKSLKEFGI